MVNNIASLPDIKEREKPRNTKITKFCVDIPVLKSKDGAL